MKWLVANGPAFAIDCVTPVDPVKFMTDYAGSVWDDPRDGQCGLVMFVGADGIACPRRIKNRWECSFWFQPMREVEGPLDWKQAYRYVGNPLAGRSH